MTGKKLKSKEEIMSLVDDWLNNFTDNTLFDISINWEFTICVQMPYTKDV